MSNSDLSVLVRKGTLALEQGNTLEALIHFEEATRSERPAAVLSGLGYCLARENRDLQRALALCQEAIRHEPDNVQHYHRLGCVYLLAGKKHLAINSFRKGLKFGRHPGIVREMKSLGIRRPPVFTSLGRKHPLNKYVGLFLDRLGMR